MFNLVLKSLHLMGIIYSFSKVDQQKYEKMIQFLQTKCQGSRENGRPDQIEHFFGVVPDGPWAY